MSTPTAGRTHTELMRSMVTEIASEMKEIGTVKMTDHRHFEAGNLLVEYADRLFAAIATPPITTL
jgi:hypothetical protein